MNQETFHHSLRKFLKMIGVNSQNEIERAVERALADGTIEGDERLLATMTLEIAGVKLIAKFEGTINLQ